MLFRFVVLACALTIPAFAQTSFVTPVAPGAAEVATRGSLEIARTGNEVLLAWVLPAGEVRMLELMRNTSSNAPGRDRVASLRADVRAFNDTVPDAAATYWYWVKLTRPDGTIVNIGPVATPAAKVWRPAP